jgi:hypothetical protein
MFVSIIPQKVDNVRIWRHDFAEIRKFNLIGGDDEASGQPDGQQEDRLDSGEDRRGEVESAA